ncbi:MAG: dockerin type I domain-containing protein [Candidatus Bathyarchaeota archaeon]|nr:dockerin type I domain-containing protein [Candidatus Bathyarchaeota archaeon]
MKKKLLITVFMIIMFSTAPAYGIKEGGSHTPKFNIDCQKPENNFGYAPFFTIPKNISHNINLHIVFIGYSTEVVDTAIISDNIRRNYELQYWDAYMKYAFNISYAFADEFYLASLRNFILQHSVTGVGITSAINETALRYQRETQTRMPIFLPQSGRAIDARAVEQWFEDNPYKNICHSGSSYTFYVLNFTEFDSPDHTWEHWYNINRYDLDAKAVNNYWRLEWDSALNPDVKFPYPAYTSKYRHLFIDPSAFQWYLTWARIWWQEEDYLTGPKYAYYYQDLDSFLASNDAQTAEGKGALAQYLSGWIDDFAYNLISPVAWPMSGNTLLLQIFMLNDVSQWGYTNEKMKWILNSTLIEKAVEALAPFVKVNVTVKFENLSYHPEIGAILNSTLIEEKNQWRYYDGFTLFYALQEIRDQYFNMKAAEFTVNSYVFLLRNSSMTYGSMEFTGLGGLQQVLLLMSIDRYFRPDGITPKTGLSMYMIHELGNNIAFPHTFSFMQYAGDFADDVMGYYSWCYSFCKMRTDMYQKTVVDMKLLELQKALRTDIALDWPWPRKTRFVRDRLFSAIRSKISLCMLMYDRMRYLDSYYAIVKAEELEAYLREILMGIRVPGDINGDGKCHVADLRELIKAYGSTPSSPNWNPDADLNKDGAVNMKDWMILTCFFGQKAKTTMGFFSWKTGARSTIVDLGEFIYPEYDMPYFEMNITYGLENWDKKPQLCLLRISDATMSSLIKSIRVTIYDETTTVGEIFWTGETSLPSSWVEVSLNAGTKYTLSIELIGTMEAYYEMTVITLECKQLHPHAHSPPKR